MSQSFYVMCLHQEIATKAKEKYGSHAPFGKESELAKQFRLRYWDDYCMVVKLIVVVFIKETYSKIRRKKLHKVHLGKKNIHHGDGWYICTLLIFMMETIEFSWKRTKSICLVRLCISIISVTKISNSILFSKRYYIQIRIQLSCRDSRDDNDIVLERAGKKDEHEKKKIDTMYAPTSE